MPRLALALFVAFQLLPSAALAFGREGHEVVAYIAFQCMSPATRIRVNHILSEKPGIVGPDLLVEAAYWPDALRSHVGTPIEIFQEFGVHNAAGTFTFHYADLDGDRYDPATGSEHGKSVVSGIESCKATLRSTTATREQKREAVCFLAHFLGDIHQPLHAGRHADKGGNAIHISAFLNRHPKKGFNLHEIWDVELVQTRTRDAARYADLIYSQLARKNAASYLQERSTVHWLEESHRLAMTHAYVDRRGRPIVDGQSIGADYAEWNVPVVEEQLAKAGVRLAALLDELVR